MCDNFNLQFVVTNEATLFDFPEKFVVPSVNEMKFGPEICDHAQDVEHKQIDDDGTCFLTSIRWMSDGGVNTLPDNGCPWAWIACIHEECEPSDSRFFQIGWRERFEIIVNGDMVSKENPESAIRIILSIMRDALAKT